VRDYIERVEGGTIEVVAEVGEATVTMRLAPSQSVCIDVELTAEEARALAAHLVAAIETAGIGRSETGAVGMGEMVERVAKALQEAHGPNLPSPYEAMARAAISAMREPTEAMVYASPEEGTGWNEAARGYAATYWSAMIDAALKPDQK